MNNNNKRYKGFCIHTLTTLLISAVLICISYTGTSCNDSKAPRSKTFEKAVVTLKAAAEAAVAEALAVADAREVAVSEARELYNKEAEAVYEAIEKGKEITEIDTTALDDAEAALEATAEEATAMYDIAKAKAIDTSAEALVSAVEAREVAVTDAYTKEIYKEVKRAIEANVVSAEAALVAVAVAAYTKEIYKEVNKAVVVSAIDTTTAVLVSARDARITAVTDARELYNKEEAALYEAIEKGKEITEIDTTALDDAKAALEATAEEATAMYDTAEAKAIDTVKAVVVSAAEEREKSTARVFAENNKELDKALEEAVYEAMYAYELIVHAAESIEAAEDAQREARND